MYFRFVPSSTYWFYVYLLLLFVHCWSLENALKSILSPSECVDTLICTGSGGPEKESCNVVIHSGHTRHSIYSKTALPSNKSSGDEAASACDW